MKNENVYYSTQNRLKCLIVDDSLSDQIALEMIISDYPVIEIETTASVEKFIDEINTTHYQLFLIDINLQTDISGIDLAKKINEPNAWVIFCSASDCSKYYSQIREISISKFYLQKPVNDTLLRIHLDSFLWFSRNKSI